MDARISYILVVALSNNLPKPIYPTIKLVLVVTANLGTLCLLFSFFSQLLQHISIAERSARIVRF